MRDSVHLVKRARHGVAPTSRLGYIMSAFAAPARVTSDLLNAPSLSCATLADSVSVPCSLCAARDGVTGDDWLGLSVVSGGTPWLVSAVRVDGSDTRGAVEGLMDGVSSPDGIIWPAPVKAGEGGRALSGKVNARLRGLASESLRADSAPWLAAAGRVLGLLHGGMDASALDAARAATAAAQNDAAAAIARADQTAALLDASRAEVEFLRGEIKRLNALAPAPEVKAEAYDEVLDLINNGLMPYLYGPAGTGKSYVCEQIAADMGWEYHQTGAILDLAEGLRGYRDIKGDIQSTEFLRALDAAENGRDVLFVFDEIDGSAPELLITLNNYLAGGCIECCGKVYNRRSNLRICACGNTSGQGATAEYVARCKLDDASLDRFELVEVQYSRAVELASAGGDAELVDFCEGLRAAAESCGVSWLVSNRRIRALAVRGCSAASVRGSLLRGRSLDAARSVYDALPDDLKACQWGAALDYVINGGR